MPNIPNSLGIVQKATPLISFGTIVDLDMSMIKYVILNATDSPYIDYKSLKSVDLYSLIGGIYRRKFENPLYFLLKTEYINDETVLKFMDSIYEELIDENLYDILKDGITTDMINVVSEFVKSGDIIPTILCYNSIQEKILKENDSTRNLKTILIDKAKKERNKFSQFYFEYLPEFNPFLDLNGKTYYISSKGLNLNETNSDILSGDLVKKIINSRSIINIFDLYNLRLIGNYVEE